MKSHVKNSISAILSSIVVITAVLSGFSSSAQDETFNIDGNHSVLAFSVTIAGGFSEVEGSFDDFSGSAVVESGTYELKEANLEIQTTSINTGNDYRDNHLRTDDFFDAENYPTITFKSVNITQNGQDVSIEGDFTMHGITKRITIPFKRSHPQPMVWIFGEPNIIYEGTTTISREAYKIKATTRWNSIVEATGDMAMSDKVSVRLKFITKGKVQPVPFQLHLPTEVLTHSTRRGIY